MYGLILVEPEGGLPPVDREFYVMQGEIYTVAPYGNIGPQEFDYEKMMAEQPEYFVFNGAVGGAGPAPPLEGARWAKRCGSISASAGPTSPRPST